MNLLKRFRLSRELARMEKRAKEDPSPSTFVDLAQAYINLGWVDHTLRVAQEGLLLFPRSEELHKVCRYARMNRLNKSAVELRSRITKHPNPRAYRELAEVYKEMGDQSSLKAVCAECIRRFPEDAQAHLTLAESKILEYYRTLDEKTGKEAIRNFMKVLDLQAGNATAQRALGKLFYHIGAIRQAREQLQSLAERGEIEEDEKALLEAVQAMPDNEEEPEKLLHMVCQKGSFVNRSINTVKKPKAVAGENALQGIREGLSRIVQIAGVKKAAYIRGSKALVKGEIKDGRDPFLKTVRVIAKAAQRAARRMDLGNFSKGVVDGSFGHICVCTFGDVSAAILCQKDTMLDRIQKDLQELVAESLFMGGQHED